MRLDRVNKVLDQKGAKGWFSNKGKIALQSLRPYLKLSDKKLLERLNSDWMLQYFCDMRLSIGQYFGKQSQLGVDKIYTTNENRKHCSALGIQTNFVPKGRRTQNPVKRKQEDKARQVLEKARSTILEGTYGNDKNHYGLQKIKARNQPTEVLWIFFGMMAANAMKIAKIKGKQKKL
jgi:hypothetical protein